VADNAKRRMGMVHRTSLLAAAAILAWSSRAAVASLGTLLDDLIEQRIERQVEAKVLDAVERAVESKISEAGSRVVEVVPNRTEGFVPDVDSSGGAVERGVWLVLAAPESVEAIERKGFTVRELRKLEHLDRVLIRVEAPVDREPAKAQLELAAEAPDVRIDHNHLYRGAVGREAHAGSGAESSKVSGSVAVGLVDSAIATQHEALRRAAIEERDFVTYDRPRPTAHGTAVASILVGDSATMRGVVRGARLRVASVFFEDDAGGSAATTASLVRALDWLAGTGVRVINMSLAGPPNRLLEAAVDAIARKGIVVTAAVGNDGPTVAPRYPAAYASVVGITSVDAANRIDLHANRGRGVMFSAPGVAIDVARADGGYENESGTSLASAHAAGIFARAMTAPGATRERVLAEMEAAAVDLGEPGFDETFGHGLMRARD
jgi:subtilisin family serine protease